MSGPVDLEAAQQLADKATEGPWGYEAFPHRVDIDGPQGGWLFRCSEDEDCVGEMPKSAFRQARADAKFIAAARSLVPALIAELAAERAAVAALTAANTELREATVQAEAEVVRLRAILRGAPC